MRHTVLKGEHLSRIAVSYGLSPDKIWKHSNNNALREARPNPHVLFEGDELFIPEREQRWERVHTGKTHVFVCRRPPLLIRIDLRALHGPTLAEPTCALDVDGQRSSLKPTNGLIECRIAPTTSSASLSVDGVFYTLSIGYLDPVELVTGQRQRLRNLGYLMTTDEASEDEPDDFEAAVVLFQRDYDLVKDGICGPKTQTRLRSVHGS